MSTSSGPHFLISHSCTGPVLEQNIINQGRRRGLILWVDMGNVVPGMTIHEDRPYVFAAHQPARLGRDRSGRTCPCNRIFWEPHFGWGIIRWMIIYMFGYFYIAGLNLIQHTSSRNRRVAKSVAA